MAGRKLPAILINRLQRITGQKVRQAFSSGTPEVVDVELVDGTQLQVNLSTNRIVTDENKQGEKKEAFSSLITRKSMALAEKRATTRKEAPVDQSADQSIETEEKPIARKPSTKVTKKQTLKKKAK